MDQLKKELSPTSWSTPTYHMDLSPWQSYSGRLDSIRDTELLKKITSTYYELEHLARKLDKIFAMLYAPLRDTAQQYMIEKGQLVNAILEQIREPLSGLINDTLTHINNELVKRHAEKGI
jgi:hypothetical protein